MAVLAGRGELIGGINDGIPVSGLRGPIRSPSGIHHAFYAAGGLALVAFGLLHAAAVVLLTEGTRLIPAPEAALLGAMEVPIAPVWALLLLGEGLSGSTLVGGGTVVLALFWYLRRGGD